jgi:DNA repair exonuclease SbcCD nuclease subunit
MRLVHLADIHICSKSIEEYYHVFDNFSKVLSSLRLDKHNDLIVIAGDIFHNKTVYTPREVSLFYYLMDILKEYQIVMIPGNHDMNTQNINDIDMITPLLNTLVSNKVVNGSNIHYLRDTCDFIFGNIVLHHISVFDERKTIESKIANKFNVLLYHGMVNGIKYGNNIGVSNSRITTKIMKEYDLVILGDIHERFMFDKSTSGITGGYCGSLIQQNIGESIDKGFSVWTLPLSNIQTLDKGNITEKHYSVNNDYTFIKIDIRGLSDVDTLKAAEKVKSMNEKHKIVVVSDADDIGLKKCVGVLSGAGINIHKINRLVKLNRSLMLKDDIKDIFGDILKKNGATAEQYSSIMSVYADDIGNFTVSPKKWTVISMKWSNLYKYGEGNFIDFTKLGGISGILAGNAMGKSSVIDILVFGLFNYLLRADKLTMINNNKKESFISIELLVNNDTYTIERKDDRLYHSTVRLYNSKKVNISGVSLKKTYDKITSMIGTYTQFAMTSLYRDNIIDIMKVNKTERLTVLSELFGLVDNKKLIDSLTTQEKKLKNEISELKTPRFDSKTIDSDIQIKTLQLKDKEVLKESLDAKFKSIMEYESTKKMIAKKRNELSVLISTSSSNNDTSLLSKHNEKLLMKLLQDTTTQIDELHKELISLGDALANTEKYNEKKAGYISSVKKYKIEIDRLKDYISGHYNEKCDKCTLNKQKFTDDLASVRRKLLDEKAKYDRLVAGTTVSVSTELREKIDLIKQDIKSKRILIYETNEHLDKFRTIKTSVERKKELESDISSLECSIPKHYKSTNLDEIITSKSNVDCDIGVLRSEISQLSYEKSISGLYESKYPVLKGEKDKISLFLKCIKLPEFKTEIIKKSIGRILININSMLECIANFKISVDIDQNIEFYIEENGVRLPILMASGYQLFTASLVARLSFISAIQSSATFLIIDEGFGALDDTNSKKIIDLFNYIKGNYSFVLVISHMNELKSTIDTPISLQYDGHFSRINNTSLDTNMPLSIDTDDIYMICQCGKKVKKVSYKAHIKTAVHLRYTAH